MMKGQALFLSLFFVLSFGFVNINAQTTIWTEDFEDDGNGSRYTSANEFVDGMGATDDYFGRIEGTTNEIFVSGIGATGLTTDLEAAPYSSFNGSFYFAAEDLDDIDGLGNPDGEDHKQILFNTIDISSALGLTFKGLFGAHDKPCGGSNYDDEEKIEVYYSIDGAPEVLALCFSADLECNIPGDVTNESFHHDPNCDGDGGEGTQLVPGMQEFSFSIPDGNTLDLRIEILADGGDEEMAFDWFRVEAQEIVSGPCTAEAGTLTGENETVCVGETLSVTLDGNETDAAYTQVFLITDVGGNVIDIQTSTNLTFATPGQYGVVSYNYETAGSSDPTPSNIVDIDCINNCCDLTIGNFSVMVEDFVFASFIAPDDLCSSEGVQTGLSGGFPLGGSYNGPGVTDDGNGMTYSFDPAVAGTGLISITYVPAGSCPIPATDEVFVYTSPSLPIVSDITVCEGESTLITPEPGDVLTDVTFVEDFEDDGNGVRYISINEFVDGMGMTDDYFARVEGATKEVYISGIGATGQILNLETDDYSGYNGDYYYAAEDTDDLEGQGNPNGADLKVIVFNTIDIAGYSGLEFSGLFAANSLDCGDSRYDIEEKMEIYYSVDGAPFSQALCFRADLECSGSGDITNESFNHDTNCDGDGDGQQLLPGFVPFTFSIPETGTSMNLRIEVIADASGEEMAFDYLRVTGTPPPTSFRFYDGDPAAGGNLLLTGDTYDPETSLATSPDSVWVTEVRGVCESEAALVVVTIEETVGTLSSPGNFCENAGEQLALGGGMPIGGVYSGPGVTDDGNGATYTFDPAAAGAGQIEITYTPPGDCAIAGSVMLEVYETPSVSFTAPDDLLITAGLQSGLGSGDPAGGEYSGPGVIDDGNGMTYDFNPMVAGVGVHTITYTFESADGCVNSASDDVEVLEDPNAVVEINQQGLALYQNVPNPFTDRTLIQFELPESGSVRLTILDVSGKVLQVSEQSFAAGTGSFEVEGLDAAGVLFYRIDTAVGQVMGKMVKGD
jgi:hypothetical protein